MFLYPATKLKNGRYEVFRDKPRTDWCVQAVVAHLGHAPCWYVRRARVSAVG